MYNIELSHLTHEEAQSAVLQAIENICAQFQMEAHFGTLSFAMHELLNLMASAPNPSYKTFNINFYIENQKVSIQVSDYLNTRTIAGWLRGATLDDAQTAAFTIQQLTDTIEMDEAHGSMWLEFLVPAETEVIDRREILQNEKRAVQVNSYKERL